MNEKSAFQKAMELAVSQLLQMKAAAKITAAPIEKDGMTVIPVSKISMGVTAGGADIAEKGKTKNPAGAGAGVTETPVAFLVISEGKASLVNVPAGEKNTLGADCIKKVLDIFKKK